MSREVRRVPLNWSHPRDGRGRHIPLADGSDFAPRAARWDEEARRWAAGWRDDCRGGWEPVPDRYRGSPFEAWAGPRPDPEDFMPVWDSAGAGGYRMYETTDGTPVSPAFATPEALARWLAETGASAFGALTAGYETWLPVARGEAKLGAGLVSARPMTSSIAAGAAYNRGRPRRPNGANP